MARGGGAGYCLLMRGGAPAAMGRSEPTASGRGSLVDDARRACPRVVGVPPRRPRWRPRARARSRSHRSLPATCAWRRGRRRRAGPRRRAGARPVPRGPRSAPHPARRRPWPGAAGAARTRRRSAAGRSSGRWSGRCPRTRREDGPDAPGGQRPGSMFARRSAAEVVPRDEDAPALYLAPVQHEVGVRLTVVGEAPVGEERLGEAPAVGRLEEPGRDDLVRVHVLGGERDDAARERLERLAHDAAFIAERGSLMTPLSAEAAAVSGEARNVRPPLPWRPSKLRLLVEM